MNSPSIIAIISSLGLTYAQRVYWKRTKLYFPKSATPKPQYDSAHVGIPVMYAQGTHQAISVLEDRT